MKMQVNADLCTGCGVCVETCPTGAIHLSGGLAILDQVTCTQCQACVDTCPVGAITSVDLPVIMTEPVAVQTVREPQIVFAKPIPSSLKPWLSAALAFVGREILPRLADALIIGLDRRLAQAQAAQPQVYLPSRNTELSPMRNSGQGCRRRSRYGQARRYGRRQGYGVGKGNRP